MNDISTMKSAPKIWRTIQNKGVHFCTLGILPNKEKTETKMLAPLFWQTAAFLIIGIPFYQFTLNLQSMTNAFDTPITT